MDSGISGSLDSVVLARFDVIGIFGMAKCDFVGSKGTIPARSLCRHSSMCRKNCRHRCQIDLSVKSMRWQFQYQFVKANCITNECIDIYSSQDMLIAIIACSSKAV